MAKIYNFSAGPAVLPAQVLERARDELVDTISTSNLQKLHLNLEGNAITDVGAAALARLLGERGVQASLKLGFNKLTEVGAATLAAALKKDAALVLLDLTYNSIDDAGVEALSDALAENTVLETLKLKKCKVGDDGLFALASALCESNASLREVVLDNNRFGSAAFEVLVEMGAEKVNWHCYSSRVKLGLQIAAHGHWLSIPANVRKAENFSALVRKLPRDKILLETDCPYLGPTRGELNEPANVLETARFAAEAWDCSLDEVQNQMSENFEALFGFSP